jgi:hypothetical protein
MLKHLNELVQIFFDVLWKPVAKMEMNIMSI